LLHFQAFCRRFGDGMETIRRAWMSPDATFWPKLRRRLRRRNTRNARFHGNIRYPLVMKEDSK